MKPIATLALQLALAALPGSAFAQIYICKDASGRTLTADRPIPECSNRPMRELDRTGVTRREIAAPLTPEQKRERQALADRQRAEAVVVEEQRLFDRALMTRYRNEGDIASARRRAIELLNEQMRIDTNALAVEMKEMKEAQAVIAMPGKNAGSVVERRRLQEASRAVEHRLSSVEQRTAEIERVHQRFDLALKRFIEIRLAIDGKNDGAAVAR